jgi:PDDEXK-like domain of unknown function (DUF3799)
VAYNASLQKGAFMQPGIYDISNEEYHASEGLSRSAISQLARTAKHYWDVYVNPDKPKRPKTRDMVFGDGVHTLVLEPHKFDERFFVIDKVSRATKAGKAYHAKVKEELGRRDAITPEEFKTIKLAAKAVLDDPISAPLEGCVVEKSIYWIDEDSGLLCKCRPDAWDMQSNHYVVDLKTTKNAAFFPFKHSVYQYHYHTQAAMIIDGIRAVTGEEPQIYLIIAVENTRPFAVAPRPISQQRIEEGREIYKKGLLYLRGCLERDEWAGYDEETI